MRLRPEYALRLPVVSGWASSPHMFPPRFARTLAFALVGLALACGLARAEPWPKVDSDLPAHPALRRGALPNGLHYAILQNAEPKDRVSLRLVVAAGSLHENDDERGLAHFVEHMVFRGTRSHPGRSLVETLQRMGIGAGPDVAAFTFFDHTVYHLELPDATEATLREGLRTFREFASEATFDKKLLEIERGVVLSEQASRDLPSTRVAETNLNFLWPGSRPARRRIGGLSTAVRQFTREQCVAFYDGWYRSERLAVVVVGNVEPADVESLMREELGALAARGPARPEPDDAVPTEAHTPGVMIHAESAIAGMQITLEKAFAVPRTRDDHARRVVLMRQMMAISMFNQRLQKISHEPDATFIGPSAQIGAPFPGWQIATVAASGKNDDWKQVAADVEQEHRRAFQFGFTAQEVAVARVSLARQYEEAVQTSPTWHSPPLANQLARALLSGNNYTHPADLQRDMAADLAATTVDDCRQAFRDLWTTGAPSIFIAANPSFNITREQIALALNASREREVTPPAEDEAVKFAYQDFGPPGQLVREEHLEDLDVRLSAFANDVRLNFKALPFEAGTVQINVRIGDGKLSQPENQPGLDHLANYAVTAGGLGKHRRDEFTNLLAGQALSLAFQIESDACVFRARCARRDLTLCLQIITAFLTDAAYRPELMRDARANFSSLYTQLISSPGGVLSVIAVRDIAGGDRRFGIPRSEELFSRNLDEVKAWLEPQFKHGPIELSVVGDTTWEETTRAVASTFAALPKRGPRRDPAADTSVVPPKPPLHPTVLGIDPKLQQCGIAWYWPAGPVQDIHEERRCRLLAGVLDERIRVKLREEFGATYAPIAAFNDMRGFPHLASFSIYAEVPPPLVEKAMQIIRRETMALATRGVETDEFVRAKQPYLRERSDNLRQLEYWSRTVLAAAQAEPSHIVAARDRAADSAAITAAEISALAKRHLDPGRSFRYITVPQLPTPAKPASGSAKAAGTAGSPP